MTAIVSGPLHRYMQSISMSQRLGRFRTELPVANCRLPIEMIVLFKSEIDIRQSAIGNRFTVRGLRWWIAGLIFLATLINFIDRLTISILAPVITTQLGLSNLQFASITTWFLVAYTASQGLSGKLYDRIGTRRGFTLSILVWS